MEAPWFRWLSIALKAALLLFFAFLAWQMIGVRQAFDDAGERGREAEPAGSKASTPASSP
jgi:hypothetical protein